jgi:hypothetical protein
MQNILPLLTHVAPMSFFLNFFFWGGGHIHSNHCGIFAPVQTCLLHITAKSLLTIVVLFNSPIPYISNMTTPDYPTNYKLLQQHLLDITPTLSPMKRSTLNIHPHTMPPIHSKDIHLPHHQPPHDKNILPPIINLTPISTFLQISHTHQKIPKRNAIHYYVWNASTLFLLH